MAEKEILNRQTNNLDNKAFDAFSAFRNSNSGQGLSLHAPMDGPSQHEAKALRAYALFSPTSNPLSTLQVNSESALPNSTRTTCRCLPSSHYSLVGIATQTLHPLASFLPGGR